ncbi:galactose oxidase-like domain-containing protein [Enterovibrio norvegicus]|uniref:galactose oxidase-like domain-containing protein n=1 Tax=Enterovibrio norvegicus TaxID=188144 RepID=UPI00352F5FE6
MNQKTSHSQRRLSKKGIVKSLLLGMLYLNYAHAGNELEDDSYFPAARMSFGSQANVRLFDEAANTTAHQKGMWSTSGNWPLYAIHMALLPNGNVITYGTDESGRGLGLAYDVWTPSQGFTDASHNTLDITTDTNVFCSAQQLLGNGSLLISGGDQRPNGINGAGIKSANVFNPNDNSMSLTGEMNQQRWYPTLTTMPNGDILVHGGRIDKETPTTLPELYSQTSGTWSQLHGADSPDVYSVKGWYYPRSFVNNKGNVVFIKGNDNGVYELDAYKTTANGQGRINHKINTGKGDFKFFYPTVSYASGKVLAFKEGKKVYSININNFSSKRLANIPSERIWSDATLLANGEVLISGGSSVRQDLDSAHFTAEVYNPANNTWRTTEAAQKARLYHSSAVLLPSGAVLVAGGGPPGPIYQLNAEMYYPDYLFDANGNWATRPTITSITTNASYDKNISVKYSGNRKIERITMVKLGSTTHSWNMGQIFREVNFKERQNNRLVIGSGQLTPQKMTQGYYMVFVIDADGVPSEAKIIKLS